MPDQPTQADFDRLFLRHEKEFRYYARSLLPSWDAVDDVLQSASMIMWRKMDQIDDEEGFRPWGRVIVRFESQKYSRTKARDFHVFDDELIDLLVEHQDGIDEPDLSSELAALEHCMEQIGDASRKLVLAPYRGHGVLTQLAEAAGRSRNSVYKQIRRIRAKLESCTRERLAKLEPGPNRPKL